MKKIVFRAGFVYRQPACPECQSRMVTLVWFDGEEEMRVGCSVCKRPLSGDELREAEKEYWGVSYGDA